MKNTNIITFQKACAPNKDTIFLWLSEPHVQEFWDNTQEHKDDILNFMNGRKTPSDYCDGKMIYWIAYCEHEPFAMLMLEKLNDGTSSIDQEKIDYLSKTGNTYGLDFMIGNKKYLGKGYGAKTLSEFINFIRKNFDNKADTFMIDPESDNLRARHVYKKSGFEHVTDFILGGNLSGSGKKHQLLIKRFG